MFDYAKLTATIMTQMENAGEWRMPWHKKPIAGLPGASLDLPRNAATGMHYQGANVLVLWSAASAMRYGSPVWATYKQWQALGAQVRKGEKGTFGIKWVVATSKAKDDSKTDPKRPRLVPFGFTVFNAAQVDGWDGVTPAAKADRLADLITPCAKADAVVAATNAMISHGGTRAFYAPSMDCIQMPDRCRFGDNTEGYYSTLLHELSHWTGHASRNARDFSGRFGNDAYAFEELVAELSAAFLCARLGVSNEPRQDHAAYLANWLQVLKNDPKALVTAASKAQQACDHVLSYYLDSTEQPADLPMAA